MVKGLVIGFEFRDIVRVFFSKLSRFFFISEASTATNASSAGRRSPKGREPR